MKTANDLKAQCIRESLESAKRQGKTLWIKVLEAELAALECPPLTPGERASLDRGLADAKVGRVSPWESFVPYLDEGDDE